MKKKQRKKKTQNDVEVIQNNSSQSHNTGNQKNNYNIQHLTVKKSISNMFIYIDINIHQYIHKVK